MSAPEGGQPLRKGLGQLTTRAARRNLLHQPRFFLRNLVMGPRFYLDKRRAKGIAPFREHVKPEADAVAAVLGIPADEYERVAADVWMPEHDPDDPLSAWNARVELLRMVGAIVEVLPVVTMVETGVAVGFSTATVLKAMETRGDGHLYSIDLPAIQYDPDRAVGNAVPVALKARWTLELGDSRDLLEPLAARVGPVDLFLHDALQTYSAQMLDFETIWPHLRRGGLLMSDGVDNPAFVEFASRVGSEPHLVLGEGHPSAIALLRKT